MQTTFYLVTKKTSRLKKIRTRKGKDGFASGLMGFSRTWPVRRYSRHRLESCTFLITFTRSYPPRFRNANNAKMKMVDYIKLSHRWTASLAQLLHFMALQ